MFAFAVAFIVCYLWHSLGITIGYHRLLSHRSFRCPKPVEYFFVLGGYLAMQGAPAWWAAVHRVHHKHADQEFDPHSPNDGRFHAALGWLFHQNFEVLNIKVTAADVLKDPVYRFLDFGDDLLQWVSNIGFRLILWHFFGWQVAVASALAGIGALTAALLLNLVCHLPSLGYRNFTNANDSMNVWWLAWLGGGEGWHNNHHAFPGSARSGMLPSEFDLSWIVISTLQKLGLATNVNDALARRTMAELMAPEPIRVLPPIVHRTDVTKKAVVASRKDR